MPSKKNLKILFVTSELFPFMKTGGLADVSASLPQELTAMGHEVRIVVPKYGAIDTRKAKIHDVVRLKDLSVKLGEKEVVFSVKSSFLPSQKVRVQIYFIDNEEYFGSRKSLYYDPVSGLPYEDNDERFIIFSKSIFELIKKLGWIPDIIHCNDWQTALVPLYHRAIYSEDDQCKNFRTLFTVHNFEYQGAFDISAFAKLGLPPEYLNDNNLVHEGKLNFLKAGLSSAHVINTVSEGYRREVLENNGLSLGMKDLLISKKDKFYGLVNGIDSSVWNPDTDKFIAKNYNSKSLPNKLINKKVMIERFGLVYDPETPVISVISRLFDYKGIDLITEAFEKIMTLKVQLVLLGTGDRNFHKIFDNYAKKYKDKFACYLGFSDELAHQIEAGSDIYLMPSKHEPCGLNQMYSLVYGTVPVVRETGGLADTVTRYDEEKNTGNGFKFVNYDKEEFFEEVKRAVNLFQKKNVWANIMKNGMKADFSWQASSKRYVDLYRKVLAND
ncbi:MAG: glycogen synthase GlgA [Ignavibacteriaceae bacterium]|nr:glycogen synthase GlgA [Ignavibacteriaceae bacterium]